MNLHNYNVVELKNLQRTNDINLKIASRNVPSNLLQPNLPPRAVPTKRILMPIYEQHQPTTVDLKLFPAFEPRHTFNPGSSAPHSGYSSNIDHESSLKNIFFPLQSAGQSKFIPNSNSDLYYNNYLTHTSTPVIIENAGLFETPVLTNTIFPNNKLGSNLFNNHTRQQRCNC
jgi:hypothetical protein